jgi:HTH-type transcriptional regulator/antitoxin HigA
MTSQVREGFNPDVAVGPGETLLEWLEENAMTQSDFALRVGLSPKTLNQIIKGKAPLSQETALKLERITNIPANFWNARETIYREELTRALETESLERDLELLKFLPLNEMKKRNFISGTKTSKVETLREVLSFFMVANSEAWHNVWATPNVAFRKSSAFESSIGAVATWLRIGELEASKLNLSEFNCDGLKRSLVDLRRVTLETSGEKVGPRLVEICSKVGVGISFVPEIPGTRLSGATRWVGGHPIIQLSLRHKSEDHFWFSFFHELGHVLLHPRGDVFIENSDWEFNRGAQRLENEANKFSENTLIPEENRERFSGLRSIDSILEFASDIGIAPGIVIGRLQKEGILRFSQFNGYKRRFVFTSSEQ